MRKTNIAVFCAALAACTVSVTAFPRDGRTVVNENRSFNRFPAITLESVFSGELADGIEPWISDRVGYRADFVAASHKARGLRGTDPPPSASADGMIKPIGAGRVKDPLLIFDDRLVRIFSYDAELAGRYADIINGCRDALPEGIRIFSLLPPTQIEFLPERYRDISDSEAAAIEEVYDSLTEGVIPVDAYGEIAKHAEEYLYFRTDHHWTALGAYYAYRAFADAAGFAPKELSEYEESAIPGFLGYYYNMEPSEELRSRPDAIYYYRFRGSLETSPPLLFPPREGERASYNVFLDGDHPRLLIKTSVGNGKTAVVIKDSFANAFIPWLAPHYENILVFDPRNFEGSALGEIGEYESADLIFLDTAIISEASAYIDGLKSMLTP
ncbi:MAG: hypothetical protein LBC28_03950, partial [Oscillospiraceae bacterium]|nr:hypothetical protein [Oscillospiraceae bacterium]